MQEKKKKFKKCLNVLATSFFLSFFAIILQIWRLLFTQQPIIFRKITHFSPTAQHLPYISTTFPQLPTTTAKCSQKGFLRMMRG